MKLNLGSLVRDLISHGTAKQKSTSKELDPIALQTAIEPYPIGQAGEKERKKKVQFCISCKKANFIPFLVTI